METNHAFLIFFVKSLSTRVRSRVCIAILTFGSSCQFVNAQVFPDSSQNMVAISFDRLLTHIRPSLFEDERVYPEDSAAYRRFKLSYIRAVNKTIHLRASFEAYNNYRSVGNGKNKQAYDQWHTRFQVLQLGVGMGKFATKKFNPFIDVGFEIGDNSWLDDWWEEYNHNQNGPGSYELRYHQVKHDYSFIGTTINVGALVNVSKHFFISASLGGRSILSYRSDSDKKPMTASVISQSNILNIGYKF